MITFLTFLNFYELTHLSTLNNNNYYYYIIIILIIIIIAFQSSCISFDHWKQVVDVLLSDSTCSTSVLHYLPTSCARDCWTDSCQSSDGYQPLPRPVLQRGIKLVLITQLRAKAQIYICYLIKFVIIMTT